MRALPPPSFLGLHATPLASSGHVTADFDTAAGDSAEMLQRRLPAPGSSAEEALALADALHGLLGQLQAWRGYFSVDKELGVWQAAYSAYAAGRPAGRSAQELREQATSLLRAMLDGMLKGGWLQDAVVPAAAAAAAGDCAMQLVITCRPAAAAAAGPLSSSSSDVVTSWGQQTGSSYPTLSGAELYAAEAALREAVSAAAAAAVAGVPSGVAVEVAGPSGGAASGFLTVSLSCEQGDADAWQRMVRLASAVVQGSLPVKLPEGRSLLLVNLQAPPSCALSLCSLCCLGQLAMRCQGLRVALATHLGADDLLGSDLLELLAGARRVKPLADVLSPAMLQQLLRSEADIAVAALRNAEVAAGITP